MIIYIYIYAIFVEMQHYFLYSFVREENLSVSAMQTFLYMLSTGKTLLGGYL